MRKKDSEFIDCLKKYNAIILFENENDIEQLFVDLGLVDLLTYVSLDKQVGYKMYAYRGIPLKNKSGV